MQHIPLQGRMAVACVPLHGYRFLKKAATLQQSYNEGQRFPTTTQVQARGPVVDAAVDVVKQLVFTKGAELTL